MTSEEAVGHAEWAAPEPAQANVDAGTAIIEWIESETQALAHLDPSEDTQVFHLALSGLVAQAEQQRSRIDEHDEPLAISALELLLARTHMMLAVAASDRVAASASLAASTDYCASVLERVTDHDVSGLSVTVMPDVVATLAAGAEAGLLTPDDRGASLLLASAEFLDTSLEDQRLERFAARDRLTEARLLLLTVDDLDDRRDRALLLAEARRWCQGAALLASSAFDSYLIGEANAVIATIDQLTS